MKITGEVLEGLRKSGMAAVTPIMLMELVAAAAWALRVGYSGSIEEQRSVDEFQAALDE